MNKIMNHLPTADLQALDAAHHMHPFTENADLAKKGVRIITAADGVMLTDSDGVQILDGMAGLWCVNIGYGRKELADVAYAQMQQLPYYNTFFQTSHVPAISLSAKLAEVSPQGFNHTFFATGGSEANDTNIRMVRHYWAAKDKPSKKIIISPLKVAGSEVVYSNFPERSIEPPCPACSLPAPPLHQFFAPSPPTPPACP